MNAPKISIIVPVFQAEKHLEECIISILGQTFADFELLLIDDGSTDKSGLICDSYALLDQRVITVHKNNEGVSAARNAGLEKCKGEYIAFIDSDDTVDGYFLENAIESMIDPDMDLFISGLYMETWDDGLIIQSIRYGIDVSQRYSVKELLENMQESYPQICICGPWCKLYKSTIIREHKLRFLESLNYGEDTNFNLDYLSHCQRLYFSEKCFYHYRRENDESLFGRFHKDTYEVHTLVYSKMRTMMEHQKCCATAMNKFEVLYYSMLVGGIHEYYGHYEKNTAAERLNQIIKVANDASVSKVRLRYMHGFKNVFLYILLKYRLYKAVALVFLIRYRSLQIKR